MQRSVLLFPAQSFVRRNNFDFRRRYFSVPTYTIQERVAIYYKYLYGNELRVISGVYRVRVPTYLLYRFSGRREHFDVQLRRRVLLQVLHYEQCELTVLYYSWY